MTTLILSDTLPQKDILINSLNVSYYYFSNISQISISNTTRIGFIWENNGYKAPFGTTVYNVILNNTSQTLYYFSQELINFFQLFTNSIVVDLITCNLNDVSFQNDLIILQNILPNITFNYSTNSTGNMPNGDWIMDSSGEDINNIYFNQNIVNYTVILGSSLVSAITHIISSKTFADIASYGQSQNISLTAGDNGSGYSTSINLPFSFSLNDVTYNSFYVTTNGLFSLSASNATSSNKSISSGAFSDIHSTLFPIISPLFANLQSTSIYYLYVNNNKFIVQWNGKISKTSFSIQIILYQYTNNIEFNYLNVNIPINTPYSIGIINDLTTNSYYKSLTATGSNAGLSGTSSVAITTINSSSNGCFHFYNSVTSIGSLQNANLTQHDLMGANLTGANLTYANLTGVDLSNCILTDTNLTGATFTNTITGPITATLGPTLSSSYSVITNSIEQKFIVGPSVNLTNANLTYTDLTGVDLSNCILTSTNLTGASFTNTITGPITVTLGPTLSSSYSVITNIVGQKFIVGPSVNLTSKNLTNANLTNANLTGATLTNTILTNANLTNTNLNGTTLNGITLSLALQIQIQSTSQLILTTNKTSNRNLNLYKTASDSYQTPSTNVSTTSTYVIPTGTTDNSFYYYKITDTITTGSSPKGWFMYTNIVNVIVNGSSVSCYNEGTKILCLNKKFNDEYVAIENLKKGDFVKTYLHGYKKIALIGKNTMINNPNIFYECMYKLKKSDRKELIDDLLITGYHSILVDDLGDYAEKNNKLFSKIPKIDDKFLLLSSISNEFEKIENTNLYTYYHLVLESENDDDNFGIWANGILSEATSKNNFIEKKYIEI